MFTLRTGWQRQFCFGKDVDLVLRIRTPIHQKNLTNICGKGSSLPNLLLERKVLFSLSVNWRYCESDQSGPLSSATNENNEIQLLCCGWSTSSKSAMIALS